MRNPTHCRVGMGQAVVAAFVLLIATVGAFATPSGLAVQTPASRSDAVGLHRTAIVVVPQPSEASRRSATAHADEVALTKRLRELGFEVWTVGPEDRPSLVRTLREAADRIPTDGEIAVFVLGTALGGDDDIYIVPSDASSDLLRRPLLLTGEAIRLGDVLRRLSARRPRDLVAIIDECKPLSGEQCPTEAVAGTTGASVVVSERVSAGNGPAPVASRPSLREPLLASLAVEGESLIRTFDRLKAAVAGSDLVMVASARLSSSFSFVPPRFFQGLRTECNKVVPSADATVVRSLALNALIDACEAARQAYPYASFFQSQLAAAQEQRAFQLAINACDDRLSSTAYRERYPAGRFVASVNTFVQDCERRAQELRQRDTERRQEEVRRQQEAERLRQAEAERQRLDALRSQQESERQRQAEAERQRQDDLRRQQDAERYRQAEAERQRQVESERQRQEALRSQQEAERLRQFELDRQRQDELRRRSVRVRASSVAAWTLSFSPALLKIDEDANDVFDAQRNLFTTTWSSLNLGDGAVAFVQSGKNDKCNDARDWTARVLERNRAVITSREVSSNPEARSVFLIEGQGFKGDNTVSFFDYVFIPASAPGMFVHFGGRYPTAQRDVFRPELISMIRSLYVRPSGQVTSFCF